MPPVRRPGDQGAGLREALPGGTPHEAPARPAHPLRAFAKPGVDDRTAAVTGAMRLDLLQEAAEGGPGRSPRAP
ncbi:hypothetical protein [Streptomyces hygroscopicus]|uniref:hypothetical protein n=1 Tax=Streptomyces hygroscopicus TaxID=1912 RepID=UPI0036CF976D